MMLHVANLSNVQMAKVAKVTGVFLGEQAVVLEDADKEKARKAKEMARTREANHFNNNLHKHM